MKRRMVLRYISVRFSSLAMAAWPTWSVCPSSSCESLSARRICARSMSRLRSANCAAAFAFARGDIFAPSAAKECLPLIGALLSQLFKMHVVKLVSDRNVPFIEPIIPALVPTNQQYGGSLRIERIEDAQRLAAATHAPPGCRPEGAEIVDEAPERDIGLIAGPALGDGDGSADRLLELGQRRLTQLHHPARLTLGGPRARSPP